MTHKQPLPTMIGPGGAPAAFGQNAGEQRTASSSSGLRRARHLLAAAISTAVAQIIEGFAVCGAAMWPGGFDLERESVKQQDAVARAGSGLCNFTCTTNRDRGART
jgi:hypothetical protein